MKNKTQDIPQCECVMCHKELVGVDIGQGIELGVCQNPACANFSLLCLPEGAMGSNICYGGTG